MPQVGIQNLLEAGVHFGHQTSRWNPNMRRHIAGELDGIHIIDLEQTVEMLEAARVFTGELTSGGGKVLFVGTKKQASDVVQTWAEKSNMPYVNRRWLPGLHRRHFALAHRPRQRAKLPTTSQESKRILIVASYSFLPNVLQFW